MTSRRTAGARLAAALLAAGGFVAAAANAVAETSPETEFVNQLPAYEPSPGPALTGTIRVWGHGSFKRDFMGQLMRRWTEGFTRFHPGVTIENRMYGTASAIGALATGAGDIALLGEEISPAAARMFKRAKGYPPTEIDVATGSLDVNFFDYAHMVFVHRDNPLRGLTLAQLDAVFGDEHRRSGPGGKNIRTWGELGLGGEWTNQPIQPYAWKIEEDFALFFRDRVLEDSHRWNPATKEYVHVQRSDGTQYDHGQQILDALARDRFGIAISNVRYANPDVRPLPLAWREGDPYYPPTKANLIAQRYPLTRIIPAFVDQPPGQPMAPAVREFLRYLLSRDGQQAIVSDSAYLPLGPDVIRAQLAKVDAAGSSRAKSPAVPEAPAATAGVVRVWTSSALAPLVRAWAHELGQLHREPRIEIAERGSDVAMAGLYTGRADVAVLGRDATANELKAFEWIFRYQPLRFEVARGSMGAAAHSPALVVFVHHDNPLTQLTLAQLDAVFSAERRRGGAAVHTWGDLGLDGTWATEPINLYAPDADTGTGRYFQEAALADTRKENWARLREFGGDEAGAQIAAALAADRFGMAVAHLGATNAELKRIALRGADGVVVAVSPETIRDGSYPLARSVAAYVNRKPGDPMRADVRAFLEFVLSDSGQRVIASGDFLPLADRRAAEQQAALAR